jgi:hypothetical protein
MNTYDRWEVGSEFHWSTEYLLDSSSTSSSNLPQTYQLFATGSAILVALAHQESFQKRKLRLHLPSFFCMEVASRLSHYYEIHWYQDLPTNPSPNFSTLNPLSGDFVLAVNFFGVRDALSWQHWQKRNDNIFLIEDHTHDPFSTWARQSRSHYAIASLRKTLPLPDGAIVWSPQHLPLPLPAPAPSLGAAQKLTAMLMKQAYLEGRDICKL